METEQNNRDFYRKVADKRLEMLINSYLLHFTEAKIEENKALIIKDISSKLNQIEELETKNTKLFVEVISAYMINQVETLLESTVRKLLEPMTDLR